MKGMSVSKRKLEVHTDASLMRKLRKGPMEFHPGYSSNDWWDRKTCGTSVSSCPARPETRRETDASGAAQEHGKTEKQMLEVVQASLKDDLQLPPGSQGGEWHKMKCCLMCSR